MSSALTMLMFVFSALVMGETRPLIRAAKRGLVVLVDARLPS